MERKPLKMAKRRRTLDNVTIILALVFVGVAIAAALVAFNLVSNMVKSWNMTTIPGAQIAQPTVVNAEGTPIAPDVPLQAVSGPSAQPWDGASRVTILIMGLDYSDWRLNTENATITLTDSMILLTVDPLSKTAGMLSIPRDMWVNIPGSGYNKINQAYSIGLLYNLPGGGPGLAISTVEKFIGVPINYYAQIDLKAFTDFIDSIGGIEIDVPEEMTVGVMFKSEVTLSPGKQMVNGEVALAYARVRKGYGDDFGRASRQQQVIMAIRDRILTLNMLPTLISKAPLLYQQLSSGIKTNLTLDQVIQLAYLAIQVNPENIKKAVIGPNEVNSATSAEGLSILVPYPDKIRLLRDQVFTTGGPVSPASVGQDPKALATAENARVAVLNGSTTGGIAAKTGAYLKEQGLNVIREGNADRQYPDTTIVIYSGKPFTAAYLATLMNVPAGRILNQYSPDAETDIAIMLGQDWARKNPMP
jgi:polyisoprenyl-teichoic acid--peptidoglycan teichoic acid transferase